MRTVISVSPFRCRMWSLHDRMETHVNEDTCRQEIESFLRHGQLVPVLGRTVNGAPDHDIELIYGARRLFVARHLDKPLLVELRDVNDREAIVAMDIENRQRKDISPYERGLSYARWLRTGYFASQDDIGHALKISASQVSRLLKIARLPTIVVDAFESPLDICECWGLDLIEALEHPDKRSAVIRRARAIVEYSPRPRAREVYRKLLGMGSATRQPQLSSHDEVVKDAGGNPMFRIRQQTRSIAIILPLEVASAPALRGLRGAVSDYLQSFEQAPALNIVEE